MECRCFVLGVQVWTRLGAGCEATEKVIMDSDALRLHPLQGQILRQASPRENQFPFNYCRIFHTGTDGLPPLCSNPQQERGEFGADRPMEKSGDGSHEGRAWLPNRRAFFVQWLDGRWRDVIRPSIFRFTLGGKKRCGGWARFQRRVPRAELLARLCHAGRARFEVPHLARGTQ